jgi:hypothetical protein
LPMAMHVHAQTYTLSWLYPLPIPFLSSSIALSPSSHYFFLFHSPGRTGMYLVFIPFDYRSPTESPAAFLFFKQRCISLTVSAHQIKTSQQHRKPSRATRRVTHETWCKKLDRPQQARTGQSTSTSRHTQHVQPFSPVITQSTPSVALLFISAHTRAQSALIACNKNVCHLH